MRECSIGRTGADDALRRAAASAGDAPVDEQAQFGGIGDAE